MDKETLTILVTRGAGSCRHCLVRVVGMGSRVQLFIGDWEMSLQISSSVTGSNMDNWGPSNLCITMEIEPRIAKQYKCQHCCSCKNYWGKGMEGGKKVSLHHFGADQKSRVCGKKCVLGHPVARATSYCLLPDTFWLRASKNVFKVGSVNFANSLSPPSIVKKVRTGSKSSQGT